MYRKTPEVESEWSPADWAVEGLRFIIDRNFEHSGYYRRGIGHLLTAISLDVQRDNRRRASFLADIARPLIETIHDETENQILTGAAFEWLGDIDLLLGN